jgi:hypothetical protein
MASLLRPTGPLPAGVYWFRRSLVVAVVLVVVLGGWWVVGGLGQGSAASQGLGPSGSHSPTASPTRSAAPTHTARSTRSPTAAATVTTCPDSVVRVLAVTGESFYPPGTAASLTVQITNTSVASCRRDVGQAALELLVYAGKTRVWSSNDCNPGGGHALVTLKPGQTFGSTVKWDRQTSAPGCPSGRPKATAGAYQLVARSLSLSSAAAPFSLT